MKKNSQRCVHRVWDQSERSRHGQQVKERFSREREKKFLKVHDVIAEMLDEGITVSQNEVARQSGISVGFINKHLRSVVQEASQRQQSSSSNSYTMRHLKADTKELEKLKSTIHRLREQYEEQRKINKALLAQVAQIVDLEDEVKLLRTQNRELLAQIRGFKEKVVNFPVQLPQNVSLAQIPSQRPTQNQATQIKEALKKTNIRISSKLRQEADKHSHEAVLKAILAFQQYRSEHTITKPGACLMKAIQEEWEPNVAAQLPVSPETQEFDDWYVEAISQGFCLDIPKKYLSIVGGELQVKVIDLNYPGGYLPMNWKEAKKLNSN